MAPSVTKRLWEIGDIVNVLRAWEANRASAASYKKANGSNSKQNFQTHPCGSGAVTGGAVWLAIDWLHEHRMTMRTDFHVQEIISMLDLAAMSDFHHRLDTVRTFINDNSVHKIDEAFWASHGDTAAFAGGVLAHAKRLSTEPVHMECSTRSNLMARILGSLGYETRVVAIFNSRTNLKSHSFLEVMNPVAKHWETQDADYDIYWQSKVSGERISLADAAEAIDEIEPCGRNDCGWDHKSREGIRAEKLKPYLDIISITAKQKAVRYALHTSRAALSTTYRMGPKQGTFCEVEAKRCKHGFFDITKYSTHAAGLPR
jgi:hypothetical protein